MTKIIHLSNDRIINKICMVRGKKVMLDRDLAELYGVTTGNLNLSVKRNAGRFPEDFMFQLSGSEFRNLILQSAISRWGGTRRLPYAFTEQGVAMLSSVLKSKTAIKVNIQIIRVFAQMKEMLLSHREILLKLEQIERKLLKHDNLHVKQENELKAIFEVLRRLLPPAHKERKRVGFRLASDKD